MTPIKQRIRAKLLNIGEKSVLLLDDQAQPVYLCFALVVRDSEVEILPESLLDDWGHEINSFYLYEWIQENGFQFPRAEIFGFDSRGKQMQCFLRELDLTTLYPCYVFDSIQTPISAGVLIDAILIPDHRIFQPRRINRPTDIEAPLKNSRVNWWHVPAGNMEGVELQFSASSQD